LQESGYITEVHHVNGEGDDAGVVYSEMQGRENTGESRTHLALLRVMYPGVCGYKSETGGILHNLRTSTSHLKVFINFFNNPR
jgi:Zn-dependent M16 (insulinase) family peptidase